MPTNNNRREVARKLRELSKGTEEVSDFDLAKTLGLGAVSRYGYAPEDVLRLADIIEPEPNRTLDVECDIGALRDLAGRILAGTKEEAEAWLSMAKEERCDADADSMAHACEQVLYLVAIEILDAIGDRMPWQSNSLQ